MRNISKEVKVGVTVVLSLGILVWGINYLKGINIFSTSQVFHAKYDRIEGLSESSPVLINGFKVGRVTEIAFAPSYDGSIIVTFSLENEKFKLPQNTMAKITSMDLLGSKSITLDLPLDVDGRWEEMGYLEPGDTLISDVERSLTDEVNAQIAPLKAKAEDLLGSIDSAVTFIKVILNKEARSDLRTSFSSIKNTFLTVETLTKRIDSMTVSERDKVSMLLTDLQSVISNVKANNENITAILTNVKSISDTLVASNLADAINDASKALIAASEMMTRINDGSGTIGKLINDDSLYTNLNMAAQSLDRLLVDLEAHPKRYVHFSLFGRKDSSEKEKKNKNKEEKKE